MRKVLLFGAGILGSDVVTKNIAITICTNVRESTADTVLGATTTFAPQTGVPGDERIGLLKADLTGVSGTVISATLKLYNQSTAATDRTFTLYSILAANSGWVEGATWNYANPSTVRWAGDAASDGGADAGCSQSGTDYNASALGMLSYIGNTVADTMFPVALSVSQVQAWLTGNYGFAMRSTSGFLAFHSDDAADAALRPVLTVVYRP